MPALGSSGLQLDLTGLSAADVTALVVARCTRQSRGSAKLTVTALRSLLGYLHVAGFIHRSFSDAVPAIARWRLAGLPKALEPDQVLRLMSVCDRRTTQGRRDFAVLSLLARLGLRAGEVAALRLEDIDWRSGEIVVRGKGHHTERLPLPAEVGAALAAYLRHGRLHGDHGRSVFLRSRAPLGPLAAAGVTALVTTAGRRAGLGRMGAHRLRHTVATQRLRAGVPLTEIGQVLRHRRPLTTAIYAKVDRDALRILARAWSGSAV